MLPNDLAILTSTWQPCPQFREFIFFSWFKTHPWFKKSNPYLFFLSNKPRKRCKNVVGELALSRPTKLNSRRPDSRGF